MAFAAARRLCRLLRAALTLAAVFALLTKPILAALGFAAAAAAIQAAVCRLPARHRFPWQRLFDEETRTRRRYERFFRSFTDLPSEAEVPARRPYAAWIAGKIRHSRDHTYLMLYTLTLVRTDIGGMLIRLTAVGALAGAIVGASGALAGWAGSDDRLVVRPGGRGAGGHGAACAPARGAAASVPAARSRARACRRARRRGRALRRRRAARPRRRAARGARRPVRAGRRGGGGLPGARAGDGTPPAPEYGARGGSIA